MKPRILAPVLAFLLSAAAGWLLMPSPAPAPTAPVDPDAGIVAAPPPPSSGRALQREKIDAAMAPVRAAGTRWEAIRATLALARSLSPADRKAWLAGSWFKHSDPLLVQLFTDELGELIFEEDPHAFLASGNPDYGLLRRFGRLDPEGLIAYANSTEDPKKKAILLHLGMEGLAEKDPAAAYKLLLEMPPPAEVVPKMARLMAKAAQGDATKLLALAEQRGDRWRFFLRSAAAEAMIAKDPAAAIHWMSEQDDGGKLCTGVYSIMEMPPEMARAKYGWLADHLDQLPDGFAGKVNDSSSTGWPDPFLLKGHEEKWLVADFERLGLRGEALREMKLYALGSWGGRDPEAAVKLLMDPAFIAPADRRRIVGDWLRSISPPAELPAGVLAVLDEASLKEVAEKTAYYQKKQENPLRPVTAAGLFAKELASGTEKDDLSFLSYQWSPTKTTDAIAYVQGRSDAEIRTMSIRIGSGHPQYASVVGEIHRQALLRKVPTPSLVKDVAQVAIHWGAYDPASASVWAGSLPAGEARSYAIRNIASRWHLADSKAAERWISSLKDPAEVQAAREAVASALKKTD